MLRFIKNWTLPIAMLMGAAGYFLLADVPLLAPVRPVAKSVASVLTPLLIFAQLLLSFCKVEPKALIPRGWHVWLLIFQAAMCCGLAALLTCLPMDHAARQILEGAMVCLICPTATAGVVITGKLGGNTSSLLTYTLLSNILAAILVPIVFPLVEPHAGLDFWGAFLKILSKVFPLLLAPFFLALIFRAWMPKVHQFLLKHSGLAFYLWAIALIIVMAQTTQSLVNSPASVGTKMLIAAAGLVACVLQFAVGKKVGTHYDDRISGGQALGQKNTVLAVWMACAYLDSVSSLGPGSYVVWQNSFNSWQLWKKRRADEKKALNLVDSKK